MQFQHKNQNKGCPTCRAEIQETQPQNYASQQEINIVKQQQQESEKQFEQFGVKNERVLLPSEIMAERENRERLVLEEREQEQEILQQQQQQQQILPQQRQQQQQQFNNLNPITSNSNTQLNKLKQKSQQLIQKLQQSNQNNESLLEDLVNTFHYQQDERLAKSFCQFENLNYFQSEASNYYENSNANCEELQNLIQQHKVELDQMVDEFHNFQLANFRQCEDLNSVIQNKQNGSANDDVKSSCQELNSLVKKSFSEGEGMITRVWEFLEVVSGEEDRFL